MRTLRTMVETTAIAVAGVALPLGGAAAAGAASAVEPSGPDVVTGEDLAQAQQIPYRRIDEPGGAPDGTTDGTSIEYAPEATESVIEARSMPYMWIANTPRSVTDGNGNDGTDGGAEAGTAQAVDVTEDGGLSTSQWWLIAAGGALLAALAILLQQWRSAARAEPRDRERVR